MSSTGYRDHRARLAARHRAVRVGPRTQLVLAAACFFDGGGRDQVDQLRRVAGRAVRALVAMVAILALIPEARSRWSWRVTLVSVAYAAAGCCSCSRTS